MRRAIDETERRRQKQLAFNRAHGITPRSIVKPVRGLIEATVAAEDSIPYLPADPAALDPGQRRQMIKELREEMRQAARELAFEKAAELRDLIYELERAKSKV